MRVTVLRKVTSLLVVAGSALAQEPADRAVLDAHRAELAAATDTAALLAREREGMARARIDRDNALLHLQLGFLAFRLGELTENKQHFEDAASEFEWAIDLQPDWPYAWYGLGLAELAVGEHSVIAVENVRQALGLDYLTKAADAFARAARADSTFTRAVVDLAETAMRQRINARMEVAQHALRATSASPAGDRPGVQLARGRVERLLGEGDSALTAFERFVAVGGDSSLGFLEQARTLFFLRRVGEGIDRYYEAARLVRDDTARAVFRSDVTWIATPGELEAFDALAPDGVHAWLERFWHTRSAWNARRPGDRLPEHYRRYFYALRHFRLVSRHRRYEPTDAYRSEQQLFDDRGIIYLRHGAPHRRAQFAALGVEPNESWLYERPDAPLIFHFVARGDVQDYKLVESLLDVFGLQAAITAQAGGQVSGFAAALFESRAQFAPVYRRLSTGGVGAAASALATERRQGRSAIRVGTTTDTYPLRFERSLDPSVQVYALGGANDVGARLLVVFAIPGRTLAARQMSGRIVYPTVVRIVATGADGRTSFLDTTRVFVAERPLTEREQLAGYVELTVEAGAHTVRAVLADAAGAAGDIIDIDSVSVPEFGGTTFTISDLVLGQVGSRLQWPSGRDTLPLNPTASYPEQAQLELYYEVHGLEAGQPYRARVEVRGKRSNSIFARIGRLFGGGGPPVAFEFEGLATGAVTRARQTVDLEPLDDGDYRLVLSIEDPRRDIRHTRIAPFRVTSN